MKINSVEILLINNPQTIVGSGFCRIFEIPLNQTYMANVQQISAPAESGIYILKSTVDNRVYIGQAANLRVRLSSHFSALRHNRHKNRKLQRFVDKYGIQSLTYAVLEVCEKDKKVLCDREQYYMDIYNPYFNIAPSAHSLLGLKMSEEFKQKIRDIKTGKKMPEGFSEIMKAVTGGEKNGMYGRKHGEETREKIRQRKLAYGKIPSVCKPVYMYDTKGNFLKSFESKSDAVRYFGSTSPSCIGKMREGIYFMFKKHFFSYSDKPYESLDFDTAAHKHENKRYYRPYVL